MMHRLGKFLLRGNSQAIAITSLMTILSFLLPMFSFLFSGLIPALVTLRKGPVTGFQVILGSSIVIAIFAVLLGLNPQISLVFAASIWVPLWICSFILRVSEAQGNAILAAGGLSGAYILVIHMVVGDVAIWWKNWLTLWLEQSLLPENARQYQELLLSAAPLINAMMATGLMISLVLTLLVARWWQAKLFNPGGFRKEFHDLRLPRFLLLFVISGLALIAMGYGSPGTVILDLLVVVIFIYLFQGIAMIHRTVAISNLSSIWLVGLYFLLFVFPQTVLFLSCAGMVDSMIVKSTSAQRNDNS